MTERRIEEAARHLAGWIRGSKKTERNDEIPPSNGTPQPFGPIPDFRGASDVGAERTLEDALEILPENEAAEIRRIRDRGPIIIVIPPAEPDPETQKTSRKALKVARKTLLVNRFADAIAAVALVVAITAFFRDTRATAQSRRSSATVTSCTSKRPG